MVTLTPYVNVAGKSTVLILNGITKIEPPIPSGALAIVVLIPGSGAIRDTSAKPNIGSKVPILTPLLKMSPSLSGSLMLKLRLGTPAWG
jgi:hypothetical protein